MSALDITLRPAIESDYEALRAFDHRLIAAAALPGATSADFERFQQGITNAALADQNPKSKLIVAVETGNKILGYIHVKSIHDDVLGKETGYLNIIAVSAEASGKGLGQALMKAAEDWAVAQGYQSLLLDVFASNERARAFYKAAGFVEDSLRLRRRF